MLYALLIFAAAAIYSQVDAQPAAPAAQACSQHHCKPATDAGCKSCDSCPKTTAAKCTAGCKHTADRQRLEEKLAELDRLQSEVDQLRQSIGAAPQILVRVKVLEVSRTKLRKLGIDYASYASDPEKGNATCKAAEFCTVKSPDCASTMLAALVSQGVGKVLAEPSIVSVSGRPASFHVGGVLPIPASGSSSSSVDFLQYGTEVDFVAAARGENKIRLELRVSVSEPDYTRTLALKGSDVPAINKRQLDTCVELASGQTAILTGLVQNCELASENDCRGCSEQKAPEEVELLFIVTPELVPATTTAQR